MNSNRGPVAVDPSVRLWQWGLASHWGARHEQQDSCGVFTTPDGSGLLAVVADGLGGHRDGTLGSRAVVETAGAFLTRHPEWLQANPRQALEALCRRAQQAVLEASPLARSTVVVLWLYRDQAVWAHIGDSRLYHFRDGQRLSRTLDHSPVELLVESGDISEEEMAAHPLQNRLFLSLGGEGEGPIPEINEARVAPSDLFALVSDGVWEQVTDQDLWRAGSRISLSRSARQLVHTAAVRGGELADNAALVLVRPGH